METTMTSIEFHNAQRQSRGRLINTVARVAIKSVTQTVRAIATWNKRRRDRAAFLQLLGKEDWVYDDLGIHRGDVEWASRLPMHMNAAKELEKLRARSMMGH
jgi:uncharacterized protein YjiS (DUF1127 family)